MTPAGVEPRAAAFRQTALAQLFEFRGFLLLLCALLALRHYDLLVGARTFALKDFGVFSYPQFHYVRESLWRGEFPLWNPLSHCGAPFFAQWITMCLYPGTIAFALLPMPLSLNWFIVLHLVLGGAGMYRLARHWTDHAFAASAAGLGYVFAGFMTCSTVWPSYLVAFGWMPFVVFYSTRASSAGGRNILWAAASAAMQLLSGAPELILMTWAVVAAVYIVDTPREEGFRRLFRLGAVVLMAAGLSAVQLLPFFELLQHSPRGANYDIARWAMPVWGWANFLVPLFQCKVSPMGYFYQQTQQFVPSYYCGAALFLLAFAGLAWKRSPRGVALVFLLLASLVFALGSKGYLYDALRLFVPQIGFARYTIKVAGLITFLVPLLAAFAVANLFQMPRARTRLVVAGAVGIVSMIGIVLGAAFMPQPGVDWKHAAWNAVGRAAFLGAFFFLTGFHLSASSDGRRKMAGFAALLVLGADLIFHAPTLAATVPGSVYLNPVQRPLASQGRESRIALAPSLETGLALSREGDLAIYLTRKREAYFANFNLLEGVPAVSGFMTMPVREENEIEDVLYQANPASRGGLLDFLGVSAYATGTNAAVWEARSTALPIITAGQRPIFSDSESLPWKLLAVDFDPRAMVLLPDEYESHLKAQPGDVRVGARIFSTHEISAQVQSLTNSLVVVAQTHYPAWKAYVDGKRVPLLRANHAFQAIEVPAGEHNIRLAYEDSRFRMGLVISLLTLVAWLVLLWTTRGSGKEPMASMTAQDS
jgi:hypothetical protein